MKRNHKAEFMANYLSRHTASTTKQFEKLKTEALFLWKESHEVCAETVKEEILDIESMNVVPCCKSGDVMMLRFRSGKEHRATFGPGWRDLKGNQLQERYYVGWRHLTEDEK